MPCLDEMLQLEVVLFSVVFAILTSTFFIIDWVCKEVDHNHHVVVSIFSRTIIINIFASLIGLSPTRLEIFLWAVQSNHHTCSYFNVVKRQCRWIFRVLIFYILLKFTVLFLSAFSSSVLRDSWEVKNFQLRLPFNNIHLLRSYVDCQYFVSFMYDMITETPYAETNCKLDSRTLPLCLRYPYEVGFAINFPSLMFNLFLYPWIFSCAFLICIPLPQRAE